MSDAYIGEVRLFAFGQAPRNWASCDGQTMPINTNQALFAIIGITYGGDGRTTFMLPNLNGRTPVHPGVGSWITLGAAPGEEAHTLIPGEMPVHTHIPLADGADAKATSPVGNTWAAQAAKPYGSTLDGNLEPTAIAAAGGSQAHENMQPYLALNFCICVNGLFPPRE